jgi:hypothetical protein
MAAALRGQSGQSIVIRNDPATLSSCLNNSFLWSVSEPFGLCAIGVGAGVFTGDL